MSDIREEKYAEWLEDTLQELVDLHPESIGIVAINEDGSTGTAYYNIRNRERWTMVEAIIQDNLVDFIEVNSDVINEILDRDRGGDIE